MKLICAKTEISNLRILKLLNSFQFDTDCILYIVFIFFISEPSFLIWHSLSIRVKIMDHVSVQFKDSYFRSFKDIEKHLN